MAGCVGVAGSAKIGKYCTFGGAAMISGHITIADHVHVTAATMISRSLPEPGKYTGYYPFASDAEWEKSAAILRNLTKMRSRLRELEKTVERLTDNKKEEN
jgi:UDP-3-O-[3-hydroxymyristoyl] glucosamine N-acyltransferase